LQGQKENKNLLQVEPNWVRRRSSPDEKDELYEKSDSKELNLPEISEDGVGYHILIWRNKNCG
jgi:hypothetical protein